MGIGTFSIQGSFPESADDKPQIIPAEAISFVYDPKVREDPDLITFLVQTTKKIKPLASADLDSFLALGRQFLNIGKPFLIHNLGTLEKTSAGTYEFHGGPVVQRPEPHPVKIEDAPSEMTEESGFDDFQKQTPARNGRSILYIFVVLLLLAAGWAAWRYIFNKPATSPAPGTENIVPVHDTTAEQSGQPAADTLHPSQKKSDSAAAVVPRPSDSVTFRILVFQTTDLALARAKMDKWTNMGRRIELYTDDSVTYKIAHPFSLPLRDTTRVRDSLNDYYYLGKARVELPRK